MGNLALRTITALILIPLVVVALFCLSKIHFAMASAVFLGLGMIEWIRLCRMPLPIQVIGFVAFLLITWGVYPWISTPYFQILSLIWLYPIWLIFTYKPDVSSSNTQRYVFLFLGYLILLLAWAALNAIWQYGPYWILILFCLVWSTDTLAYFVGRQFGKRKLAEHISPKKTIEGFWGGVIGTLAISTVLFKVMFSHPTFGQSMVWLLMIVAVVLMSVLGDLFESLMKRIANVKDSSQWLPGHGGILDRIDSLIAALPFFLIGLNLIGVK